MEIEDIYTKRNVAIFRDMCQGSDGAEVAARYSVSQPRASTVFKSIFLHLSKNSAMASAFPSALFPGYWKNGSSGIVFEYWRIGVRQCRTRHEKVLKFLQEFLDSKGAPEGWDELGISAARNTGQKNF